MINSVEDFSLAKFAVVDLKRYEDVEDRPSSEDHSINFMRNCMKEVLDSDIPEIRAFSDELNTLKEKFLGNGIVDHKSESYRRFFISNAKTRDEAKIEISEYLGYEVDDISYLPVFLIERERFFVPHNFSIGDRKDVVFLDYAYIHITR